MSGYLISLFARTTIILILLWLALFAARNRNPRWSALVIRFAVGTLFVLPLLTLTPSFDLRVLPAATVSQPEANTDGNDGSADGETADDVGEAPVSSIAFGSAPPVSDDHRIVDVESERNGDDEESYAPELEAGANSFEHRPASGIEQKNAVDGVASESTARLPGTNLPDKPHSIFLSLWLVGTIVMMLRMLRDVRCISRLRRNLQMLTPPLQGRLADSGLAKKVVAGIRLSREVAGPCSVGWFNVQIVLPSEWADSATEMQLQTVIAHEQSHVRGCDPLWQLLTETCRAAWWFHPLIWKLPGHHRLLCEHISDAEAAKVGGGAEAYRRNLAAWALEFNASAKHASVPALSMADRSRLHRRLQWISQSCRAPKLVASTMAWAMLICGLVTFSASTVTLVRAEQPRQTNELSVPGTDSAAAQQEDEPRADDAVQTCQLVITNKKGEPIPSAIATLRGWTLKSGDEVKQPTQFVADDDGEHNLEAPANAARVAMSVFADGYWTSFSLFFKKRMSLKVGASPKSRVHAGRIRNEDLTPSRLWVSPFNPSDGANLYIHDDGRFFLHQVNNSLVRLVAESEIGQTYFSDLIRLDQLDGGQELNVELKPAIRLRAKLDESVPRPVKRGVALLSIRTRDADSTSKDPSRPWEWAATTEIEADGSFEFSALPSDGVAEIFVAADGFQAKPLTRYEAASNIQAFGVMPEGWSERFRPEKTVGTNLPLGYHVAFVHLAGQDIDTEIGCERAADLTLRVLKPDGAPFEGAQVDIARTDARFFSGGAIINRMLFDTKRTLTNPAIVQLDVRNQFLEFLAATTRNDGVASLALCGPGTTTVSVKADGYQMPSDPVDPASEPKMLKVAAGAGGTIRQTITLEVERKTADLELLAVDNSGTPLPDIRLTVVDIAFEENDGWETWSAARFGNIATATTSNEGRAVLRVPTVVGKQSASAYRINADGFVTYAGSETEPRSRVMVKGLFAVPREHSGKVIVVDVPEQEPSNVRGPVHSVANARFAFPEDLWPQTMAEKAALLVEKPGIALLRDLLRANEYTGSVPLRFEHEVNLLDNYNEEHAVERVATEAGDRIVALARVRPKNATWDQKNRLGYTIPEAAFVFEADTGRLLSVVGGKEDKSGQDHVTLSNIGYSEDCFISLRSPVEDGLEHGWTNTWYRLARVELGPSLTVRDDRNWMRISGRPSNPPAEFGSIGYSPLTKTPWTVPGRTADGIGFVRRIVWDARLNRFMGIPQLWHDDRSLYRVVQEESAEFDAVKAVDGEILVSGGFRLARAIVPPLDNRAGETYSWEVVTPQTGEFTCALTTSWESSPLWQLPLKSGQMTHIQLSIASDVDRSSIAIARMEPNFQMLARKPIGKPELFVTRRVQGNASPAVDFPVFRSSPNNVVLLRKPIESPDHQEPETLFLVVYRNAKGEAN